MKIIKNKIFITLLFFLILFILNNTNVFALTFTYDNNDYNIDLPEDFNLEDHPDFIIKKSVKGTAIYQLAYPASDYDLPFLYYSSTNPKGVRYYITGTTTCGQWKYYNYYPDTGWDVLKTTSKYTITYISDGYEEGYCIFSTADIYDTNGELFFQKTPVTVIPETIIPALETAEQIPTAMVETLKMIIPVGLVIFGVLLLILLTKLAISRMT